MSNITPQNFIKIWPVVFEFRVLPFIKLLAVNAPLRTAGFRTEQVLNIFIKVQNQTDFYVS